MKKDKTKGPRRVTEGKQAEELWVQASKRLELTLDNLTVVAYEIDSDGKWTLSRGKGLEKLGRAQDETVGLSIFEFYKDNPAITDAVRSALEGKPQHIEVEVNGVLWSASYIPVVGPSGKIERVYGTAIDITDRKRAEKDLREAHGTLEVRVKERTTELAKANEQLKVELSERKRAEESAKSSEERFRVLFEDAPDAYYLNDLTGTFVDSNRAAEKMTGYKKEELIGKNFLRLNLLSPMQIVKAAGLLGKNVLGRPTGPDEFTLNRKDGTQVSVEITTNPLRIKNQALVLGISRDITARKQAEETLRASEERYRDLVDNSLGLICAHDLDGILLSINPAAAQVLGLSSGRWRWTKLEVHRRSVGTA